MIYEYPSLAIKAAQERLATFGQRISQKSWQSVESPDDTWELLNHHVGFRIPGGLGQLISEIRPNLPWAEDHFKERVCGIPLNPGEQYKNWPFFKHVGEKFKENGTFSHSYMERFWPKFANVDNNNPRPINQGVRFRLGDYEDVIQLIAGDFTTRQAFIPIWFPEDTGVKHGERVPCTLGYHLIVRNGYLHINYYMRSCDIIRHFRDDIYMASRLVFDMISKFKRYNIDFPDLKPGQFNMYITSLHCFYNERNIILSK